MSKKSKKNLGPSEIRAFNKNTYLGGIPRSRRASTTRRTSPT